MILKPRKSGKYIAGLKWFPVQTGEAEEISLLVKSEGLEKKESKYFWQSNSGRVTFTSSVNEVPLMLALEREFVSNFIGGFTVGEERYVLVKSTDVLSEFHESDSKGLAAFLAAASFQNQTPLIVGEAWVLPTLPESLQAAGITPCTLDHFKGTAKPHKTRPLNKWLVITPVVVTVAMVAWAGYQFYLKGLADQLAAKEAAAAAARIAEQERQQTVAAIKPFFEPTAAMIDDHRLLMESNGWELKKVTFKAQVNLATYHRAEKTALWEDFACQECSVDRDLSNIDKITATWRVQNLPIRPQPEKQVDIRLGQLAQSLEKVKFAFSGKKKMGNLLAVPFSFKVQGAETPAVLKELQQIGAFVSEVNCEIDEKTVACNGVGAVFSGD